VEAMALRAAAAQTVGLPDLLAQQAAAIQQVTALHQEILKTLGTPDGSANALKSPRPMSRSQTPNVVVPKVVSTGSPPPAPRVLAKANSGSVPKVMATSVASPQIQAQTPIRQTSPPEAQVKQPTSEEASRGLAEPLLDGGQQASPEASSAGPNHHKHHSHHKDHHDRAKKAIERKKTKDGRKSEVFPSVDKLKDKLLEQIRKPKTSVESMYSTEGIWQAIARDENFQNGILVVIVLNVLWIAYDTDNNKADVLCNAPLVFQIANNIFCIIFTAEIFIRFMAFRNKADCLKDNWFIFDSILVALMIWETWIEVGVYMAMGSNMAGGSAMKVIKLFRIFRLTRIARLVRLLRHMPELTILLKGMLLAMKSVGAALFLLVLIIYVFAILFTQQLSGTEGSEGCFDNVPQAANCLLLNGVFSEQREFIERMMGINMIYYVVTMVYLLLASTTVMNMLIGILCEVIAVTARVEQEELMLQNMTVGVTHFLPPPKHGEHMISKEDFCALVESPDAVESFEKDGIDVMSLVDCCHIIFKEKEEIPLPDFIESVLQFRSENKATVKDIVNMKVSLATALAGLEERIDSKLRRIAPPGVTWERQISEDSADDPNLQYKFLK
jgi:voltage-gated sodium channel